VRAEGRAHDNDFHDSVVLGAGRTPDTAQAARMQVRLDTGHVLPVSHGLLYRACINHQTSSMWAHCMRLCFYGLPSVDELSLHMAS